MGFWDACCNVVGSFCTSIKETATSIVDFCIETGKAIFEHSEVLAASCRAVGAVLSVVYPPLGIPLQKALSIAALVLDGMGKIWGILKPDENIRDMGERCMEAEERGIVPEKFLTFGEYAEKVRETPLSNDPGKYTDEQRLLAGCAFTVRGLEDEIGIDPIFLETVLAYEAFFNGARLASWENTAERLHYRLPDVAVYFTGQGSTRQMEKAWEFMCQAEKAYDPASTPGALYETILDLKEDRIKTMERARRD